MPTYRVQAPDGSVTEFVGPDGMTDDQKITRAQQEYAFKNGSIPTTYAGGVQRSIGDTLSDHSNALGNAVGLAGIASGQPWITAASPAIGRAIKAGGQYISGRKVDVPSAPEIGLLAAEGALTAVPTGLGKFAATTVPHVSPLTGQFIKGISGSGVPAWMGRTAGEAAYALSGPATKTGALEGSDLIRQYIMEKLNAGQSQ